MSRYYDHKTTGSKEHDLLSYLLPSKWWSFGTSGVLYRVCQFSFIGNSRIYDISAFERYGTWWSFRCLSHTQPSKAQMRLHAIVRAVLPEPQLFLRPSILDPWLLAHTVSCRKWLFISEMYNQNSKLKICCLTKKLLTKGQDSHPWPRFTF